MSRNIFEQNKNTEDTVPIDEILTLDEQIEVARDHLRDLERRKLSEIRRGSSGQEG